MLVSSAPGPRSLSRFRQRATPRHLDTSRAKYCLPRPTLRGAKSVPVTDLRAPSQVFRRGRFEPATRAGLEGVLQALHLRQRREPLERGVLNLPDPLAGDAEGAPHLLERSRQAAMQPEAELDHPALALGQRGERVVD